MQNDVQIRIRVNAQTGELENLNQQVISLDRNSSTTSQSLQNLQRASSINIDVNSSQLQGVQSTLTDLQNSNISVNTSVNQSEISALQTTLTELQDRNLNVDIDVSGSNELDSLSTNIEDVGQNACEATSCTDNLGSSLDNTTRSGFDMTGVWTTLGVGIVAVTGAMGLAIVKGAEYEQQTALLTTAQRELTDSLTIVEAGYAQTALSAGLSTQETEKIMNMSKALGRAFPNESVEEFVNNLTMLNSSGEAQGYIVDILEQKLGMVDIASMSLADKMTILDDVTMGVNERFEALGSTKIDEIGQQISTTYAKVGQEFLEVSNNLGWIDASADSFQQLSDKVLGNKDDLAFWGITIEDVGGRTVSALSLFMSPIKKAIAGFEMLWIAGQMAISKLAIEFTKLELKQKQSFSFDVSGQDAIDLQNKLTVMLNNQLKYNAQIRKLDRETNNDIAKNWAKLNKPLSDSINEKYNIYLQNEIKTRKESEKTVKDIQSRHSKSYADMRDKYKEAEDEKVEAQAKATEAMNKELEKRAEAEQKAILKIQNLHDGKFLNEYEKAKKSLDSQVVNIQKSINNEEARQKALFQVSQIYGEKITDLQKTEANKQKQINDKKVEDEIKRQKEIYEAKKQYLTILGTSSATQELKKLEVADTIIKLEPHLDKGKLKEVENQLYFNLKTPFEKIIDVFQNGLNKIELDDFGAVLSKEFQSAMSSISSDFAKTGDFGQSVTNYTESGALRDGLKSSGNPYAMAVGYGGDIISGLLTDTIELETNLNESNTAIVDSMAILNDVMNPHLAYTSKMLQHLENMDKNFSQMAISLSVDPSLTGAGYTESMSGFGQNDTFQMALSPFTSQFDAMGLGFANDLIAGVGNALASSKTTLVHSGLVFGEQLIDDFVGAVDVQAYQHTSTKSSFLGGLVSSTKDNVKKFELENQSIATDLSNIISTGYQSILDTAQSLDIAGVETALDDYVVDLGMLDFKDKTEAEIKSLLSGTIGAALDGMAELSMPELNRFKDIGESYYTTVSRVATGYEQAEYQLEKLNIEVADLTEVASQGDVAFSTLQSSMLNVQGNQGINGIIEGFRGTAIELRDTYVGLMDLQFGLQNIGATAIQVTQSLIEGAGSLEALAQGHQSYIQNFFSADEQYQLELKKSEKLFADLGLTIPSTNDGFKNLVETTKSGISHLQELSNINFEDMNQNQLDEVRSMMEQGDSSEYLAEQEKLLGTLYALADPFAKLTAQQDSLSKSVSNGALTAQQYTQTFTDQRSAEQDAIDIRQQANDDRLAEERKLADDLVATQQKFELYGLDGLELLEAKHQQSKEIYASIKGELGVQYSDIDLNVSNFFQRYNEVLEGTDDPGLVANWDRLGDALISISVASKAVTENLDAEVQARRDVQDEIQKNFDDELKAKIAHNLSIASNTAETANQIELFGTEGIARLAILSKQSSRTLDGLIGDVDPFAKLDLSSLSKFEDEYENAIGRATDPETITRWNNLRDGMMDSLIATEALEVAINEKNVTELKAIEEELEAKREANEEFAKQLNNDIERIRDTYESVNLSISKSIDDILGKKIDINMNITSYEDLELVQSAILEKHKESLSVLEKTKDSIQSINDSYESVNLSISKSIDEISGKTPEPESIEDKQSSILKKYEENLSKLKDNSKIIDDVLGNFKDFANDMRVDYYESVNDTIKLSSNFTNNFNNLLSAVSEKNYEGMKVFSDTAKTSAKTYLDSLKETATSRANYEYTYKKIANEFDKLELESGQLTVQDSISVLKNETIRQLEALQESSITLKELEISNLPITQSVDSLKADTILQLQGLRDENLGLTELELANLPIVSNIQMLTSSNAQWYAQIINAVQEKNVKTSNIISNLEAQIAQAKAVARTTTSSSIGFSVKDSSGKVVYSGQDRTMASSIARNEGTSYKAFADGGIVTAPTMGLIGEAGYSEAVIPLKNPNDPLGGEKIAKLIRNLILEVQSLREQNQKMQKKIEYNTRESRIAS